MTTMDINALSARIEQLGIVPVVKLNDAKHAVPLAEALIKGGLPVAEITFRTDAAADSILAISKAYPDMLVGAGTVLSIAQVDEAIAAGAKFIVTPGFNPKVVTYCVENGIPIYPGCPTTSDIELAIELGLKVVKFFPAEQLGGLATIKAVSAPYGGIKFMPTGGVNEQNLNTYLAFDKIVACGGSWMVKPEWIDREQFEIIEGKTHAAVNSMLGFEIGHVGVNCPDDAEAYHAAQRFGALFGWPYRPGEASDFAGDYVELMHRPGRGAMGHICVLTNSTLRAMAYLKAQGVTFDESSISYDKSGRPVIAYLNEEIGGFAIHLKQK